jgi:hypothetical protein
MSDVAILRFSGRDSMAQFMAFVIIVQSVGWIFLPVAWIPLPGGAVSFGFLTLAVVVIIAGLRASIVVKPSRVVIVRKCFFIPYWCHIGRAIEGIQFGGDWGDPEGAIGVVVILDGKELHIGSGKTMHYLYSALLAAR